MSTVTLNEHDEGVRIGSQFTKQPLVLRVIVALPLIYIPIIVSVPFIALSVLLVRWHLWCLGARNMKGYWEFVPAWVSHRYTQQSQIVSSSSPAVFGYYKWFWIFNCKIYCPMSVALLRYNVYLVKIVENWWCPFTHERKQEYSDASIDYSFWHVDDERRSLLHEDDLNNPIWNKDATQR